MWESETEKAEILNHEVRRLEMMDQRQNKGWRGKVERRRGHHGEGERKSSCDS